MTNATHSILVNNVMLQLVVVLICSTNASKFQAANKIFVVTRCQPSLASCRQFGIEKKPKVFALGFFVRVNQAINQKLTLINTPKYRDQPRAGALFLLPLQGFHRYVLYVSLHHLGEAVR